MPSTVISTDWTAESLNSLFVITVCVNAGVTAKGCGLAHFTSSQQGDDKKQAKGERCEGMNSDLRGAVVRGSKVRCTVTTEKSTWVMWGQSGTYSSHGVDAVDVVVGPAGGQLVGVLLLLCMDTNTDWIRHSSISWISSLWKCYFNKWFLWCLQKKIK